MTREVVWSGHDESFVKAMITELGILIEEESATVAIIRTDQSMQMYAVDDGYITLSLIAGPNRLEVRRRIAGTPDDSVVELSEARARRVRLHCLALVDRIQANALEAAIADDDPPTRSARPPSL